MNKAFIFFLLFISILLPHSIFSQTRTSSQIIKERVRESLKEKIRVPSIELWLEAQSQHPIPNTQNPTPGSYFWKTDSIGEVQITQQGGAESEVHAAISPLDSNIIIVSAMKQNPSNLTEPLTFPTYYTSDFGNSWNQSSFKGEHPNGSLVAGGGDPVIVFDAQGKAHLTWLLLSVDILTLSGTIALYHATSPDSGKTWNSFEKPINKGSIDILSLEPEDRFVDKQWMAADRSQGIHQDNIYMAYVQFSFAPDTLAEIVMQRKLGAEDTFRNDVITVNTDTFADIQFASIDVDHQGDIHVSFWGLKDSMGYSMYHAKSNDGGLTFQPEVLISQTSFPETDSTTGFPASNIVGLERLYPCPHIKVDKSGGPFTGNLYSVWTARGTDSQVSDGFDIYYSKSTDGGDSWTPAIILNDDTSQQTHQFFPNLYVNDQGILLVSWYDRRDDSANVNTHYYMTYSLDGGDTFEPQTAVSTLPADFSVIGSENGNFGVGEYTQIIASDNYAIPVWADGRDNDGSINIYTAFVELNTAWATAIDRLGTMHTGFSWTGPSPNPATGIASLSWELEKTSMLEISLFDLKGRMVKSLAEGQYSTGEHELIISTHDLPSGIYLIKAETDNGFSVKRFSVVSN